MFVNRNTQSFFEVAKIWEPMPASLEQSDE